MMSLKLLLVVSVCALVAANSPIISPITNCGSCLVYQYIWTTNNIWVIRTSDENVYTSVDGGQTFSFLLPAIKNIFQWPSAPLSLLFQGHDSLLYYSTDGGQTYLNSSLPSVFVRDVKPHPNNPGTLLTTACPFGQCTIYVTTTYGATGFWRSYNTSTFIQELEWSTDYNDFTTLFATINQDASFAYTTNYGMNWTIIFEKSFGFYISPFYLYVGVPTSDNYGMLYASPARADSTHRDSTKYLLADFTFGEVFPVKGYSFLDQTTDAEFIAVKDISNNYWGNVFSSDFNGISYSISIPFAAERNLAYDFDSVGGLPGVFIANSYASANLSALPGKVTKISFNNGASWRLLTPPATDREGNAIACDASQGCSLQLHGLIDWYYGSTPPFYSLGSTIGLIVAIGGAGTSVDTANSTTVFSRDAGITWSTLFDTRTVYEFGDHGGILVFAEIDQPTNTIYYSRDQGITITPVIFSRTGNVSVDNIICEPSGTGLTFLVLARNMSNQQTYLYGLDFADPTVPPCQNPQDYEQFTPSNGEETGYTCFMGATTTYLRRKQNANCYNNLTTSDTIVQQIPCACAFADYECDVGFYPTPRNSTDGFSCIGTFNTPACATGYRLEPDTNCTLQGGLNLGSQNCPGYSGVPTSISGPSTTTTTTTAAAATSTGTGGASSTTGTGGATASGAATATSGNPSSTTGSTPVTGNSTSGGDKKSNAGGIAAGVILGTVGGAAAVAGLLYWKNERFRTAVRSKLGGGRSEYSSLLPDNR